MVALVADYSVFASHRLHIEHLHFVAEHLSREESGWSFLYSSGPQVMRVHNTNILGLAGSLRNQRKGDFVVKHSMHWLALGLTIRCWS